MGVVGAGIGTAISVWVGTALYLRMGYERARGMGFASAAPTVEDLKTLALQAGLSTHTFPCSNYIKGLTEVIHTYVLKTLVGHRCKMCHELKALKCGVNVV